MLHLESPEIRSCLLQGKFGLEKEGLRVCGDGSMALSPHPFDNSAHITRDFCENQTEINTSVEPSAEGAVHALECYSRHMARILERLPEPEYIWPFSNPPYLGREEEIQIARFKGELSFKTVYREYLSKIYGRRKMTFSGIHINYSFSEELLQKEFSLRGEGRSRSFRDSFYLELAEKASAYGWLLIILTAASPVLDMSYFEAGSGAVMPERRKGRDVYSGMASVRCSDLGYWNAFMPVFDYTNLQRYADSIRRYEKEGMLYSVSELYYPVRLKSKGENSLDALKGGGVDHIELRMFDLNPFVPAGLDVRDVQFVQLFLVWLASIPRRRMSPAEQVLAGQNFKNAARFDLETVRIVMPELAGEKSAETTAQDAAMYVMEKIREFYRPLYPDLPSWVESVLDFEFAKIRDPEKRYAARLRKEFSDTFLEKGMERAVQLQRELIEGN